MGVITLVRFETLPKRMRRRERTALISNQGYTKDRAESLGKRHASENTKILIEQFDRVIYLLRKELGVNISQNLAIRMLEQYRRERISLYWGNPDQYSLDICLYG